LGVENQILFQDEIYEKIRVLILAKNSETINRLLSTQNRTLYREFYDELLRRLTVLEQDAYKNLQLLIN
jgi:hypothetical protein